MMEYTYKYIIIGAPHVGKSFITSKFITGVCPAYESKTIGVEFGSKMINLSNGIPIKVQLWDAAGHDEYQTIVKTYYGGAIGGIFVYSVDDLSSFEHVEKLINDINKNGKNITHKVLVANKIDISNKCRVISTKMGKELADKYDISYIETSARTGENVHNIFQNLSEDVYCSHKNDLDVRRIGISVCETPINIPERKRNRCCILM